MPCEVSGASTLVRVFAAVGVEGAGQQQAGELAVGAGRGLQADVRQAADLGQRLLQQPHQLQRALGALRVLGRVQAGVAGQRRDPLVEPRVVLHRAGAERVEAGVEVEVAAREPVVVADDLRLGDLGQARRLGAQQAAPGSAPRAAARGLRRRAATAARRPGFDFSKIVVRAFALHRRLGRAISRSPAATFLAIRGELATLGGDRGAERLGEARRSARGVRRSVIATSRPSSCSGYSRPSG